MRFFAIAALLSVSVYALPQGDYSVVARSAEPEAIAEALAESAELYARAGKTLKVGAEPKKDLTCLRTANPGHPVRNEHKYTKNQLKSAFLTGAKLNAEGKQIGPNRYPHKFNSNQAFPNGCGTNTHEFPIRTDNKVYNGEVTNDIPDRVLYEVKESAKEVRVKFCAAIRHGVGNAFVNCA
ncbi:hypothetical protein CC86DRAFT_400179 [Ophiobolus disseminans]|uniref:ribonuclease T1 n=1 Tax=Ophiobolus disseminans TaxID=1469910 RepID=A0A6A7ALY0_9PLEO|nr:hypothetical protein CC86DRAFT_400179 [Ophiobolus disseminans]